MIVRNAYRESRLQLEDVYFYPFQELEIQRNAFPSESEGATSQNKLHPKISKFKNCAGIKR